MRLLYDLGCAFSTRIELDDLIPFVIAKCRNVLDAAAASVLLLDGKSNELYFPYVAEGDEEVAARLAELRFPADRGIAGAVLRTGKAVRVDDMQSDPRFYNGIDRATGSTTRNALCAPLIARQGNIGVIQVINRRNDASFTDDDLAFLESLAGSVGIAIENAQLYARVRSSEQLLRVQVGALRRDLARQDRFTDMIACEGDVINQGHLSRKLTGARGAASKSSPLQPAAPPPSLPAQTEDEKETVSLRQARAVFEADFLRRALDRHERNVSRTARALGISRVMLQKKMKEYGLR